MKNEPDEQTTGKQVHRVVTFLDRVQVDHLDKMGKDALFSTGVKFPRTRIISALVDLLRKVNISGEGLKSDSDLEDRLIQKVSSGAADVRRVAADLMVENRANTPRVR